MFFKLCSKTSSGSIPHNPHRLLVAIRISVAVTQLVQEHDAVGFRTHYPLASGDDSVGPREVVFRVVGLLQNADPDFHEITARLGFVVPDRTIFAPEFFDRAHDRIVLRRAVVLEPLAEVLVAFVGQTLDHAGPVETAAAVVASVRVRQQEFRMDFSVRNFGLRKVLTRSKKTR